MVVKDDDREIWDRFWIEKDRSDREAIRAWMRVSARRAAVWVLLFVCMGVFIIAAAIAPVKTAPWWALPLAALAGCGLYFVGGFFGYTQGQDEQCRKWRGR